MVKHLRDFLADGDDVGELEIVDSDVPAGDENINRTFVIILVGAGVKPVQWRRGSDQSASPVRPGTGRDGPGSAVSM